MDSQNSSLSSESCNGSIENLEDIQCLSDELRNRANMRSKKRHRREPQRFGKTGALDMSDSFDEALHLYGDNSFDDKDFIPETGKIIATATDLSKRNFKKKKIDETDEPSGSQTDADQSKSKTPLKMLDLNDEFNLIMREKDLPSPIQIASADANPVNDEPKEAENTTTIEILDGEEPKKEEKASTVDILVLDYCKRIMRTLDEQSVRILMAKNRTWWEKSKTPAVSPYRIDCLSIMPTI